VAEFEKDRRHRSPTESLDQHPKPGRGPRLTLMGGVKVLTERDTPPRIDSRQLIISPCGINCSTCLLGLSRKPTASPGSVAGSRPIGVSRAVRDHWRRWLACDLEPLPQPQLSSICHQWMRRLWLGRGGSLFCIQTTINISDFVTRC
jgi:hypothetical protein